MDDAIFKKIQQIFNQNVVKFKLNHVEHIKKAVSLLLLPLTRRVGWEELDSSRHPLFYLYPRPVICVFFCE
jgi:hypothetical protein